MSEPSMEEKAIIIMAEQALEIAIRSSTFRWLFCWDGEKDQSCFDCACCLTWDEEEADKMGVAKQIFLPAIHQWEGGYKQRNLKIARTADVVHCIVVAEYPKIYVGMRFDYCYHCKTSDHIKSGGCWTAKRAKKGVWHII